MTARDVTRDMPPRVDWRAVITLLKPITWFPPMWAFACGVVSVWNPERSPWLLLIAGMALAGPMVCGTSQAVNDWFDRHVDAINEPGRPIPSGRIPGRWGLYIAILWSGLSLLLAATLGTWVFLAAALGLALAWAYSAPPLRLKQNGWWGNSAVAICYEGLPWFTGAAVITATLPDWRIITLALLYSFGAHGIMTLNDFKSIEGDTRMGLRSLPVQLGAGRADEATAVATPRAGTLVQRHGHQPLRTGHAGQRPGPAIGGRIAMSSNGIGWPGIIRLGLVQTALGSIVVLTTATMNRVMVVEMALPAMLPGALVGLHYTVQLMRPRFGYGSDLGGRRTPWIIGGMAVLAAGGIAASIATAWMATNVTAGILLAVLAFTLIGVGVGASGTSLLVLLAKLVDEGRRAAAATTVWLMMIAGFIITAATAGHFLDPFSPSRLVIVTSAVCSLAFLLTWLAVHNVEKRQAPRPRQHSTRPESPPIPFRQALAEIWAEPTARRFTVFVFISMLAYSAQDLILEPFAGLVFGMTPGQSTQLSGVQSGGLLAGMILVALLCSGRGVRRIGSLRGWMLGGCMASAAALAGLAIAGLVGPPWPLTLSVFALGFANGTFAVAAIGSMMRLVGRGREAREGVRMGLWGAAQAMAFGLGGFLGTAAVDLARFLLDSPAMAYAVVFSAQGLLFLIAARLAVRVESPETRTGPAGDDTENEIPALLGEAIQRG